MPAALRVQRPPLLSQRALTLAVGLALLLAVLLSLAGLAVYERAQVLERVNERNELMARVFADQANRTVEAASLVGATLAEQMQRGLPPASTEMRTALQQTLVNLPFMRGMAIVDGQGVVLGSADGEDLRQRVNIGVLGALPAPGRDVLGRYVPARRLRDLADGRAGGTTPPGAGFLPLLRGVQTPGGERLAVVGLLNPQAFANFQQVTMNDPRAAAALVGYDGQLVAAAGNVARDVGSSLRALPPFTDFLPRLEHGTWVGDGLRPGAQVAAFRVAATRPLLVMVELGHDDVMEEWRRRARGLAAAAAAAVVLIGLMTAIAARSLRARESARRERDLAQAQVAARERELSVTMQSLQELVFRTDAQGRITFVNQRWGQAAGDGAGLPQHLWDRAGPGQQPEVRALFATDGGPGVRRLQAAIRDSSDALRSFDIAVMPLLDDGHISGYAGSATDVTALVATQRRLRTQLALTEQLMEISPLPSSVTDTARRYVMVNQAWELFTGRRRADVIGQLAGAHLTPEQRVASEDNDRWLLATGQASRYEDKFPHADGTLRDVVVNKLPLAGEDGQPYGILSAVMDVTEFRHAERATREARDAAEDASKAKSEFIANISHELRTPLQSIIGFSELGTLRGREQPRLAAMFHDIHSAGQRMLALVNDLLDVAKIESTVGTIHLERTDLRGLVREVLHELDPLLATRRLQVALHLPEYPLRAKVDPLRFQQLLRNVLANAIKFSPEGGHIDVDAEHTADDELHIAVSDGGRGIPPAELESIFEAFVQSSSTKDGSGGTGLGLAICRKIVDAHGGRIHAKNRATGGAIFHIYLPARAAGETLPAPL